MEIISGGTKLGFSATIAQSFLKDLIKETPSVETRIRELSKNLFPIATLRVPQLLNYNKNEIDIFDTSITLKLKKNIHDDVQSQIISGINKETLIFLNHIEEIEIDSPERKQIFKKIISGDTVTVTCNDNNESKTWHLNKINGIHKYKIEGKDESKNYELAIAWNDKLDDNENFLFCNFKTKAKFPFPALLHGTFELTQNRNQLENDTTGHNEFLTEKLAELLVDTALKIASQKQKANYQPLSLLNIDFNQIDPLLTSFNFKEKLLEKIKVSKVFPTVNGKYIDHLAKPKFYDYPIADYLEGDDVENLILHHYDQQFVGFIKSFKIFHYSLDFFLKILSKRITNKYLAKLLFNVLTCITYQKEISSDEFDLSTKPEFLIDNKGEKIHWKSTIFLQPPGEKEFILPQSLSIQFVSPELIQALLKEFGNDKIDELLNKLKPFRVKKYSFAEISETLIQHYTDKKNLKPTDVNELHSFLFPLYLNEVKELKPEALSKDFETPILSVKREVKSATKLYFGKSYGNTLTEQLYSYDKSKILIEKKELGLEKFDTEIVKDYFSWLGVAELPRYQLKEINTTKEDPYIVYLLRNFKYPVNKFGSEFKTYNDLKNWFTLNITLSVGEFDDIDKILTNTKIENIFSWVQQDKNLKDTLENDREILNQSKLHFFYRTDRIINRSDLRSFTKWKISITEFLPVESKSLKSAPEKCCLSKTITSEFSPYVEKPKISIEVISEKLQLSEDVIEGYLIQLGVHREISTFSIDILYNMLLALNTSDNEGNIAKTIYREVISNFNENKIDISYPTYKEFLENGKVLCVKGNETGYFPISEAYYIETKVFGNNILKRFPLVCIDRKRGRKKVERLFGIKSLEKISFKIIGDPKIHCLNHQFSEEINRFKVLIYALRLHQDTRYEIKNRLKRLRIILTYDINAEFIHNQITEKFDLEQYEFIGTKNKSNFHILISETDNVILDLQVLKHWKIAGNLVS